MTAKFRKTVTAIAIVAVAGLGASMANAGTNSCYGFYRVNAFPFSLLLKKGEIESYVTRITEDRLYIHVEARPGTVPGYGQQCINMTIKFKLANGKWSTAPEKRNNICSKKTYDFNRKTADFFVSCS
jgi:hypothetical protein